MGVRHRAGNAGVDAGGGVEITDGEFTVSRWVSGESVFCFDRGCRQQEGGVTLKTTARRVDVLLQILQLTKQTHVRVYDIEPLLSPHQLLSLK